MTEEIRTWTALRSCPPVSTSVTRNENSVVIYPKSIRLINTYQYYVINPLLLILRKLPEGLFYDHKFERTWKRAVVAQSKSSAGYFLGQLCKVTDVAAVSRNGFPTEIRTSHLKRTNAQLTAT